MPDTTPGATGHPEPPAIGITCDQCGTRMLNIPPNAVTVNVPARTVQVACAGPDQASRVHVATRAASWDVITLLHQARVPFVPQGDGARLEATVMGARIYAGEPVPQWPAVTA